MRFSSLLLFLALALACDRSERKPPPEGDSKEQEHESRTAKGDGTPAPEEPVVHIPVGEFKSGSVPTQPGRDPALEPVQHDVKLGPFRIDRNLYSGADAKPQLVTEAKEAEALCARRGGRLCTELEWERACRGPASTTYPGGQEPCSGRCPSGFDVERLTQVPEWTASLFGEGSPHKGEPVIRGAPSSTPAEARACSRRLPGNAEVLSSGIAFRCCYGAPNAERVREPKPLERYEETSLTLDELKELLESDPHTKPLTQDLAFFKEDAAATVLARGPGDTMGFTLTTRPVKWSPATGVQLLVAVGQSGKKTAFVVAYFLGASPPKLAGSFIMKNERGPIALAYAPSIRPRMHFSGCWGCPGETGKLLYRPKETIVLLQP